MLKIGAPLLILLLLALAFSGGTTLPEERVKSFVLANLSHPETAEFRNLKGACGEVRYLDYFRQDSGFKRFVATSGSNVVIEVIAQDRQFRRAWSHSC
ncbi:hypothetical protein [Pseudomonas citronellolis]|uniref:hypothetical protein n=1 Tax=Pseudomonas citronellolis TaxID=53408 RepID=UPI0023E45E38|nr:hypothetical protein [Pseudomonas citronellolis]MDF3931303.1 hypothetical protein [Pseudomonas citronellolis]